MKKNNEEQAANTAFAPAFVPWCSNTSKPRLDFSRNPQEASCGARDETVRSLWPAQFYLWADGRHKVAGPFFNRHDNSSLSVAGRLRSQIPLSVLPFLASWFLPTALQSIGVANGKIPSRPLRAAALCGWRGQSRSFLTRRAAPKHTNSRGPIFIYVGLINLY